MEKVSTINIWIKSVQDTIDDATTILHAITTDSALAKTLEDKYGVKTPEYTIGAAINHMEEYKKLMQDAVNNANVDWPKIK